MPTLEVNDDFESGSLAAYTLISTPTITTADAHSGTHSVWIDQASNVAEEIQVVPPGGTTVSVGRFFVKLHSFAATTRYIVTSPLTNTTAKGASIRFQNNGTVDIIFGGAIVLFTGLTVQLNRWYRVDYRATCGQNPYTLDAQITDDLGVQYAASTTGAFAADTFKVDRYGNVQAEACDLLFDDLAISRDPADYPIGWPVLYPGLPASTPAAYGPTLAAAATIPAGFASESAVAYGATPTAASIPPQTLLSGVASSTPAADGPVLAPGAATLLSGFASAPAAAYGATVTAAAIPPQTLLPGSASSAPAADGPAFAPGMVTLPAGFAGHPAVADGPALAAVADLLPGFAPHAASADGPVLAPGAATILAGAATRGAAAPGPSLHTVASLAAGFASSQPVAYGAARLVEPLLLFAGMASGRSSSTLVISAGSALRPSDAGGATGASGAAGSLRATAAASTVGVAVDE